MEKKEKGYSYRYIGLGFISINWRKQEKEEKKKGA